MADPRLGLGRRVWVASEGGRAYGRVAYLPKVIPAVPSHFVVLLDGENKVLTCLESRRGERWDFAKEDES